MAVNLARNSRVYITTADLCAATPVFTALNTWEIKVQDGFSFNQNTEASVVQLNEAGDTPARGQRSFTDRRSPAEWSLSTYLRPYRDDKGGAPTTDDTCEAPEFKLWAALMSDSLTTGTSVIGNTPTRSINTQNSNKHRLATIGIIFVMDSVAYAIVQAAVNTAEVSFDLTGIASVAWSGMGAFIKQLDTTTITATPFPAQLQGSNSCGGLNSYIMNKLSTLELASGFTGGTSYVVPITGGSFTYSNNIEYVTPDNMGVVDTPIGYFTGSRSISGSMTAYLRTGEATDTGSLFRDMLAGSANTSEPKFRLKINVGGPTTPKVSFDMPFATLTIPTVEVQDIVSTSISYTAQGATGANFDAAASNELTITYHAA